MKNLLRVPLSLLVTSVALTPGLALAGVVTIEPTGNIPSGVQVLNYYNGGYDSHNDGPGPSDGVVFTLPVEVLTPAGHSKAENAPSNGVLYSAFSSSTLGVSGVLNDASGFSAISLQYSLLQSSSNPNGSLYASTIYLYSGVNGTGTQLGSLALTAPTSPTACTVTSGPNADEFCTWQTVATTLASTAESLVFSTPGSTANEGQEFDNIQLTATPLPATAWMMLSGLLGLGFFARRNRS